MKNLKNKIFSLLISFSMIIGMGSFTVFAVDEETNATNENVENMNNKDEINKLDNKDEINKLDNKDEINKLEEETYTIYYHFFNNTADKEVIEPLVYPNLKSGDAVDFTNDLKTVFDDLAIDDYHKTPSNSPTKYVIGDPSYEEVLPNEKNEIHLYAYYEYLPFTVTFRFLEEGTNNEIRKPIVERLYPGVNYDFRNVNYDEGLENYQIVKFDGDLDVKVDSVKPVLSEAEITKGSAVVNYYYRNLNNKPKFYNITVNYIEEKTNTVLSKPYISPNNQEGFKYNMKDYINKEIKGYKIVKVSGDSKSGVLDKNKVINVLYEKDKEHESAAKTSDNTNVLLWGIIGVVAIVIIIFIRVKYYKK